MNNIRRWLIKHWSPETVYAHCDIPCGVYSPEPAMLAAVAALRMVQGIQDLPMKGNGAELLSADNNFMRMVVVKEREAQRCKEELLILWTDYFKSEHLSQFPDLHEIFWQAAKQCSVVKRGVSVDDAKELAEMVARISEMFDQAEEAKGAKK